LRTLRRCAPVELLVRRHFLELDRGRPGRAHTRRRGLGARSAARAELRAEARRGAR